MINHGTKEKGKDFWKTKYPFFGKNIPKSFFGIDREQSKKIESEQSGRSEKEKEHDHMIKFIQSHFEKTYVQNFLLDSYQNFIKEYIKLANKCDCTYAFVWKLKEEFLTDLFDHTKKEVRAEARYSFYNEGKGWRITFDGKTLSSLTGKGFQYLHYLVSNPNKELGHFELSKLDGIPKIYDSYVTNRHIDPRSMNLSKVPITQGNDNFQCILVIDSISKFDDFDDEPYNSDNVQGDRGLPGKDQEAHDTILDDKYREDLMKEKLRLQASIKSAKKDGDPEKIRDAEEKLKKYWPSFNLSIRPDEKPKKNDIRRWEKKCR